jgi:hypothetical protein
VAVKKSKKGAALKKWFKEEWVDVKTGKPCGRKSAKKGESKRPYPSCRPKAVAAKMTKAEKASSARRKTGPKAIKHAVNNSYKSYPTMHNNWLTFRQSRTQKNFSSVKAKLLLSRL